MGSQKAHSYLQTRPVAGIYIHTMYSAHAPISIIYSSTQRQQLNPLHSFTNCAHIIIRHAANATDNTHRHLSVFVMSV